MRDDNIHGYEPKILQTYENIMMKDAKDHVRRKGQNSNVNSVSESVQNPKE